MANKIEKVFPVIASIMFSVITVALVNWVYGFYFEESEAIFAVVFSGSITERPYTEYFTEVFFLLIPAICFVFDCFKEWPMYGIFHLVLIAIYSALWYFLLWRILGRVLRLKVPLLAIVVFFVGFCLLSVTMVNVNSTRSSLMISSGALLLYFDYYVYDNKRKRGFFLWFVLGCFIRISMGGLSVLLASVLYLIYFRNAKKVFSLLKFHWIAVLMSLMVSMGFVAKIDYAHQRFEYAQRAGRLFNLSDMNTAKDSMAYLLVTEYGMMSDPKNVDEEFITSMVSEDEFMRFGISNADFNVMKSAMKSVINDQNWIVIYLFYAALLFLLFGLTKRTITNVVLYNIFSWVIILLVAMKIKMESYVFWPWFAIVIGSSIALALTNINVISRPVKLGALGFLLGVFFVSQPILGSIARNELELGKIGEKNIEMIHKVQEKYLPVLWGSRPYGIAEVLSSSTKEPLKESVCLSLGAFMYHTAAQKRCVDKYGFKPTDWSDMYRFFNENKNMIRFLMDESSACFVQDYYRIVYGQVFVLEQDMDIKELPSEVYAYKLISSERP